MMIKWFWPFEKKRDFAVVLTGIIQGFRSVSFPFGVKCKRKTMYLVRFLGLQKHRGRVKSLLLTLQLLLQIKIAAKKTFSLICTNTENGGGSDGK